MDLTKALKLRIINLANGRNMSISKLCTLAGISRTTLSKLYSGKTRFLRLDIIEYICESVGISLEEFFNSKEFYEVEVKE